MKRFLLVSIIAVMCAFSAAPAQAYFTTSQRAYALTDTTALFLIDFSFGHEKYDLDIPVLATQSNTGRDNIIGFSITDDEREQARGNAVGIVFSNTPLRDGMYRIPKGTSADFMLAVIYTKDPKESENRFSLSVTHLPFAFSGVRTLELNPSELSSYKTDYVSLPSSQN